MSVCPCVKGKKISDIKQVNLALNKFHGEDRVMVHIHKLFYNSNGKVKSRKQNLRTFFGLCSCDPEPLRRRVEKIPGKLLRDIVQIFDCPISAKASVQELQDAVMHFVFNPQPRAVLEAMLEELHDQHSTFHLAHTDSVYQGASELDGSSEEDLSLCESAQMMSEELDMLDGDYGGQDNADPDNRSPKRLKGDTIDEEPCSPSTAFPELFPPPLSRSSELLLTPLPLASTSTFPSPATPPPPSLASEGYEEGDSHCDTILPRLSRTQKEVRRLLESEPLLTDEMLKSRMPISLRRQKREPKPVLRRHQRPATNPQPAVRPTHCAQPVSPNSSGVKQLKVRAICASSVSSDTLAEPCVGQALPGITVAGSPEMVSVCSSVGHTWSSSPSAVTPHSQEGAGQVPAQDCHKAVEAPLLCSDNSAPSMTDSVDFAGEESLVWLPVDDTTAEMPLPTPPSFCSPTPHPTPSSELGVSMGLVDNGCGSPTDCFRGAYWEGSDGGEEAIRMEMVDEVSESANVALYNAEASSSTAQEPNVSQLLYHDFSDVDTPPLIVPKRPARTRGRPKRKAPQLEATSLQHSLVPKISSSSRRRLLEVQGLGVSAVNFRPCHQQRLLWTPPPEDTEDFPDGEPCCWPVDPTVGPGRSAEPCELGMLCEEFLPRLQVAEFLRRQHDQCFCLKCYPKELPGMVPCGGHKFIVPRGWKRFGVEVLCGKARANDIWRSWHVAFHGLSVEGLRRSFLHGQILLPGDKLLEGGHLGVRKGHIPAKRFFFSSPTVKYAELDMYATPLEWLSAEGFVYEAKVVLQVRQKPGTFQRQRESVGAVHDLCKHTCNEEIEWFTDNRAAVVVTGILLRLGRKR